MREERPLSSLRRLLGLAMIVAGISITMVQLAKGGAPARLRQASPASVPASEAPGTVNAKLETRAVGVSLDATLREIAEAAEKPEWVGYQVEEIAGDRGVCCDSNWNYGNCGTCRLEKENGGTSGATHTDASVKLEELVNSSFCIAWKPSKS
jgi:hypothetical protein